MQAPLLQRDDATVRISSSRVSSPRALSRAARSLNEVSLCCAISLMTFRPDILTSFDLCAEIDHTSKFFDMKDIRWMLYERIPNDRSELRQRLLRCTRWRLLHRRWRRLRLWRLRLRQLAQLKQFTAATAAETLGVTHSACCAERYTFQQLRAPALIRDFTEEST